MAEPMRLTETGPQRQAAGAAPHWPRPLLLARPASMPPCSLWQESSESTNTTIEDEDTKGRGGALPLASGPQGLLRPPSLTAPGLKGPQCQPCVLLLCTEPHFGSFQTEYTVPGVGYSAHSWYIAGLLLWRLCMNFRMC